MDSLLPWQLTLLNRHPYYYGLTPNYQRPTLLARSSGVQWPPPFTPEPRDTWTGLYEKKRCSVITASSHPLSQKLREGLRGRIEEALMSMRPVCWISVDYVRLGYEVEDEKNTVTVVVTVERGILEVQEAERIVAELKEECER
jgi:hypothetical protein